MQPSNVYDRHSDNFSPTVLESTMFNLTSVNQYYRHYFKIDNYLKMDSYWCQLNYRFVVLSST